MKTGISTKASLLVVSMVMAAGNAFGQAAVLSPTKRQDSLEAAKRLLADREPLSVPEDGKNPFYPKSLLENGGLRPPVTQGGEVTQGAQAGPRSDRDLLVSMADAIKPSGYFILGGEPILMFGQKRVKAGGVITITFEGTEYTVEIPAIDRTSFTLRYNREEYTRPIK